MNKLLKLAALMIAITSVIFFWSDIKADASSGTPGKQKETKSAINKEQSQEISSRSE